MGRWVEARRDGRCMHCKTAQFAAGDEIWVKSAGVYYCQGCGLLDENVPQAVGQLEAAVMKELAKLPEEAGEGVYAQNLLYAARQLDAGDIQPREVPQYQKEMRINLMALQDAFPAGEDDDETEVARQKRERRARENGGY